MRVLVAASACTTVMPKSTSSRPTVLMVENSLRVVPSGTVGNGWSFSGGSVVVLVVPAASTLHSVGIVVVVVVVVDVVVVDVVVVGTVVVVVVATVEVVVADAVDAVCANAQAFHSKERLDVYGKARLNNNLLWALRESGYEADFIDEITKQVIISLSAKPKTS